MVECYLQNTYVYLGPRVSPGVEAVKLSRGGWVRGEVVAGSIWKDADLHPADLHLKNPAFDMNIVFSNKVLQRSEDMAVQPGTKKA